MTFTEGAKDGKHYWLTPPDMMAELDYWCVFVGKDKELAQLVNARGILREEGK